MKKVLFFTILSFILFFSCTKDVGKLAINPYANCDTMSYTNDIAPIISANCSTTPGCHITGFTNGDFTSYGGIIPKIQSGAFFNRVLGPSRDMPDGGPVLADSLVQKLQCWINQGYPNN